MCVYTNTSQELVEALESNYRKAAEELHRADVLLFATGAGFSADSGLATYQVRSSFTFVALLPHLYDWAV